MKKVSKRQSNHSDTIKTLPIEETPIYQILVYEKEKQDLREKNITTVILSKKSEAKLKKKWIKEISDLLNRTDLREINKSIEFRVNARVDIITSWD